METEIIRISSNDSDLERLTYCADVIKRGGLVVFPTETVYGLGADATSADAAKKIYKAKGRPSDNPLIIHVATPSDAEKYAYTSELYYRIAYAYMPGPITVIMRAKDSIPSETRGGLDTVAVRCPENPIARRLIELSEVAIAAPSANLSGSPSPTSASHVVDDMLGRVDVIIDGGDSEFGLESTIVRIDDEKTLTLLRPGRITPDELRALGCEVKIASAVMGRLGEGEVAQSPGMKYRHYAPNAPLVLLDGDTDSIVEFLRDISNKKIAILSYSDDELRLRKTFPDATIYSFGERNNEQMQAHRLFSILREADKASFDVIYAPLPRVDGIGLALYNRMIRAASHTIIKL